MKLLALLFLISSHLLVVHAQHHPQKEEKFEMPKGDLNCIYKFKYSIVQRNKFYPFNIADTIKLVSFHYHRNNYPIKSDTLIVDSLVEIKTLSMPEINILTDI